MGSKLAIANSFAKRGANEYLVIVNAGAEQDIYRNAAWGAENHSLDQAIQWQAAIYMQLEFLQQLPERCSLAIKNANQRQELRQLLEGHECPTPWSWQNDEGRMMRSSKVCSFCSFFLSFCPHGSVVIGGRPGCFRPNASAGRSAPENETVSA